MLMMQGASTADPEEDGSPPASAAKISLPIYFEESCGNSGLVFAEPKPVQLASIPDQEWILFRDKLNEVVRTGPTIPGRCVFAVVFMGVFLLSFLASFMFFCLVGPEDLGGRMLHCSSNEEPYTVEYCDEELGWQLACYFSYFALPLAIIILYAKKKRTKLRIGPLPTRPIFLTCAMPFRPSSRIRMVTSLSTAIISLLTFGVSSVTDQAW
jgi:hypothetical protein